MQPVTTSNYIRFCVPCGRYYNAYEESHMGHEVTRDDQWRHAVRNLTIANALNSLALLAIVAVLIIAAVR